VRPAELPSVAGGDDAPEEPLVEVLQQEFSFVPPKNASEPRRDAARVAAAAPVAGAAAVAGGRARPRLRVTNWWSGKYQLEDDQLDAVGAVGPVFVGVSVGLPSKSRRAGSPRPAERGGAAARRPAAEQLRSARARAEERRARAHQRMARHRTGRRAGRQHASGVNAGVAMSLFIFLAFCVGFVGLIVTQGSRMVPDFDWARAQVSSGQDSDDYALDAESDLTFAGEWAPEETPALPALSGCALVVNDLGYPLDPQFESLLQGVVAAMKQAGLEVRAILPGLELDDEETEVTTELIAELTKLRNFRPLHDAGLGAELTEWLEDQGEAEFLLWIEPSGEQGKPPRVELFTTTAVMEEVPDFLSSLKGLFSLRG